MYIYFFFGGGIFDMFNLSTLETVFLKFPLPYIAKAALIGVLIIFLMMIEEKKTKW